MDRVVSRHVEIQDQEAGQNAHDERQDRIEPHAADRPHRGHEHGAGGQGDGTGAARFRREHTCRRQQEHGEEGQPPLPRHLLIAGQEHQIRADEAERLLGFVDALPLTVVHPAVVEPDVGHGQRTDSRRGDQYEEPKGRGSHDLVHVDARDEAKCAEIFAEIGSVGRR